jgi:hypothetical protein
LQPGGWFNANDARKGSIPEAIRNTFFEKEIVMRADAQEKPAAIPTQVIGRSKK